jgi:hypothetical protein
LARTELCETRKYFIPSVNHGNEIALLHNLNYKYTRNTEGIRETARLAVGGSFEDWIYSLTCYHSATGGCSLGGKYLIQTAFDVKYPQIIPSSKDTPIIGWAGGCKINEYCTKKDQMLSLSSPRQHTFITIISQW